MIRPLSAALSATALAAALALVPSAGVAAVPAQAPGCDVVAATLDWGFKESFRAYIDGSIANGEWTVADGATYATPEFSFPAEAGRIDPRDPNGSVAFAGSVRFTGHGGVLDTTIANPVIVIRPDGTGLLLLDVSGATMEGDEVVVTETPFVDVDLAGQDLTPARGVISIVDAPTALTPEGEVAFPNYPAGEAFDPITATFDVGSCDLEGQPIGTDTDAGDEPSEPPVDGGVIDDATPFLVVVAGVAGVLVLAGAALLIGFLVGRRR